MYITSPVRLVLVFLFAFESRRNERGTLRKENQNSVLYDTYKCPLPAFKVL